MPDIKLANLTFLASFGVSVPAAFSVSDFVV